MKIKFKEEVFFKKLPNFRRCNHLKIFYISIIAIILSSCSNYILNDSIAKKVNGELAVEIFNHSQRVDKLEYLSIVKHPYFISPVLLSTVSTNKQAMLLMNKTQTSEYDTIYSLEEIPIYKESTSTTRIYSSGKMETEIQDITPDSLNPIITFTANPLPAEATIKKTLIEDGVIKAFNGDGKLINSLAYTEKNMKAFIDTLKYYVVLAEKVDTLESKSTEAQLNKSLRKNAPAGSKIIKLSNGNVVLEQMIDNSANTTVTRIRNNNEPLRSRTELNPEMNKTIKFEIFQGNQLLQQRSYIYSNNESLKNSKNALILSYENPEVIISESLIFDRKGIPMIKSTQEHYLRNQMVFHF